ncbi:MAG: GAF domain-containing sensor histidine kinase [Acidobacteria bacterium]|nr:GAF domain-containing sensor histidine kinase [Acidobacteriota bacterium]
MGTSVHPEYEQERLKALRRFDILDTPPDGAFDRITALAARLFHVPISIVSLVDHDRIWFKSRQGLDVQEVNRDLGLCASAILSKEVYSITNAIEDPRSLANPLVAGSMGFRFYAAAPLRTNDGYNLGTLCVIDGKPRHISEPEKMLLQELAEVVMDQMELRLNARRQAVEEERRRYSELERLYQKEQEVLKQLQHLDHLKTNFMLVTSHEMRTPLTVLSGYTEMLSEGLLGELEPIQKKALDSCHRMVERLNLNFNKILEMVKLSEGRLPLNVREVDISGILSQGLLELEPFIERRNLSVVKEIPALSLAVVDPEKIHLVFLNLFQNAIKYTPDGGTITVRLELAADGYQVAITDTGVGIHPSELNQIFELFYTTDDLSTHQSGTFEFLTHGTGLGLAIAKKHIEAHGGRIWAESNGPGQGSCFNVWFPGLLKN